MSPPWSGSNYNFAISGGTRRGNFFAFRAQYGLRAGRVWQVGLQGSSVPLSVRFEWKLDDRAREDLERRHAEAALHHRILRLDEGVDAGAGGKLEHAAEPQPDRDDGIFSEVERRDACGPQVEAVPEVVEKKRLHGQSLKLAVECLRVGREHRRYSPRM